MHNRSKVLVIGTTPDYIEWIRNVRPGEVLFVTSPEARRMAVEPEPVRGEELLCDLTDEGAVFKALKVHLSLFNLQPVGIACFDCESLMLAASIAERLRLPYPSTVAVGNCRDKYISKTLWQKNGIGCPEVFPVRSAEEASAFFKKTAGHCVLKPLNGSGSELVFNCGSEQECHSGFHTIMGELVRREKNRLYAAYNGSRCRIIAEEYVDGDEYSCDFLLDGEHIDIIRISRKIKAKGKPFGTIRGYIIPAFLPKYFTETVLPGVLAQAARSLSLSRCICMADFMVREGNIVFLEMTPRPGGDCLPSLLRCSCGLDILGLSVDFAAGRAVCFPDATAMMPHIGLRFHAETAGILKRISVEDVLGDSRVREIHFPRGPGHEVKLPPEDYDAWLLGHVIFSPTPGADPESECTAISEKVGVEIEKVPS